MVVHCLWNLIHFESNGPNLAKIVKIAMLSLILTDENTDLETKRLCVMAAMRMKYITEEEANQLLLYRVELEEYRNAIRSR